MIEQTNKKRSFTTVRTFLVVALCLVVGIGMCEASVPKQQQTVQAAQELDEAVVPTETNESPPVIEEAQPTVKPETTTEEPSATQESQPTMTPEATEKPSIQGPQQVQGPTRKETKKKSKKKKTKKRITITATRDIELYRKADSSSKVIRKVKSGSKLKVTEGKNGYLKTMYKTKKGQEKIGYVYYLYTTYLKKAEKKIVSSVKMPNTRATIGGTNVNFRSKPNITSKVKKTLDKDEVVQIIRHVEVLENEEEGWYFAKEISTGMKAYIYGKYVDTYVEVELPSSSSGSKDNSEKETSTEETKKDSEKETSTKETKKESKKEASKEESKKEPETTVVIGENVLAPETEKEKKEEKAEEKNEEKKKKETKQKKKSVKKAGYQIEPTDKNAYLLAQVGDIETGYKAEKGKVMQTFLNKAIKFKTTLRKILTAPKQYPTTRRKIDAGKIKPAKSTIKLAKQILSGKKNGFEGTDVPKSLWNKVMYQASDDPSKWSYPVTVVSISQHYYALDYLMKKNGKPVYHLNEQ